MSILSELFGGGKNPSDAANQYLNKIPDVGHQYYDPYINQGQESGMNAHHEYDSMTKDPTGFINKLMEQYQPSQGYQFQKGQLEKALGSAAAAGGVAGTPLDQMNQGQAIQGLLSGDMQQFLQNALNAHTQGLTGQENEATRGFNASGNMADLMGGSLNQQGGIAFNQAQQQNQNKTQMFQSLIKALMAGAGGLIGGPGGMMIGGGLGSFLNGSNSGQMAMPMSGSSVAPWANPG